MNKEVVDKINASGHKFYFALTGGGTGLISEYLSFGGASKSLIGANVPYNQRAFDKFINGQKIDTYASEEGARKLAVAAFDECLDADVQKEWALGVGASCSIASTSPEREGRKHKIHIAFHGEDLTMVVNVILNQGRTRACEEEIINSLIYKHLAFITLGEIVPIQDIVLDEKNGESFKFKLAFHPGKSPIKGLIKGDKKILTFNSADDIIKDSDTIVIYSGSWNPIHDGHKAIIEKAENITGKPVILELSVDNAEKGKLDFIEISNRKEQIKEYPHILTSAPHFRKKAEILSSAYPSKKIIFVVGYDTWLRIWEIKHCLNFSPTVEETFFRYCNTKFLVFGRGNPFVPLSVGEDLRIKDSTAEQFSLDISSTELRKQI